MECTFRANLIFTNQRNQDMDIPNPDGVRTSTYDVNGSGRVDLAIARNAHCVL